MALTIIRIPAEETPILADPTAPEVQKPYTILDAIAEYAQGRGGVLMLMNIHTFEVYEVVGYDADSGKTLLRGSGRKKKALRVKITQREAELYIPHWRD